MHGVSQHLLTSSLILLCILPSAAAQWPAGAVLIPANTKETWRREILGAWKELKFDFDFSTLIEDSAHC